MTVKLPYEVSCCAEAVEKRTHCLEAQGLGSITAALLLSHVFPAALCGAGGEDG